MIIFKNEKKKAKAAKNKPAVKSGFSELMPRVTITSALPYVNGVKHLGNIAGSMLPADIFHRFLDLMGIDNIYVCGTDDHGAAAEIAAEEEKMDIENYVKKYYKLQKQIYELWNFDFTFFGQTSSATNREITKAIFLKANENGYVIKKELTIPYCLNCKRYLPDRYITGTCPVCGYESARGDQCELCGTVLDPVDLKERRCAICGKNEIEFKNEKHLFLDYNMLSDKLKKWIEKQQHWPYNTKTSALGWIEKGLKPRGISRNLKWGFSVPLDGFEHLVFYVWFDAPIGYISITKDAQHAGKVKNWKEYWTNSKIYHFLGKDNIPFHTIFWPGTLIASRGVEIDGKSTNFLLPYKVVGYEFLNWEGQKFSTSKGIGLFSDEALELFPVDYWRFYLSYLLPENKDSNFSWDDFAKRINNDLIANYGNLFYRVTHFIKEHFDGKVPKGVINKEGQKLYTELAETVEKIGVLVKDVKLREALKEVLALASSLNKYFQEKEPWAVAEDDKADAADTLFTSINLLRSISILLYPFIPATAETALKSIGAGSPLWSTLTEVKMKPGQRIEARLLFKKIEKHDLDKAKQYKSRYAKKRDIAEKSVTPAVREKPMIKFEDFNKLDLVVGTITDVRDHPNAEKLYVLSVDLGKEVRQLVAGLKGVYKKDELSGRQVVVVANLEPKELRGVRSHGMLLASDDGTLLSPVKDVKNGSKVR